MNFKKVKEYKINFKEENLMNMSKEQLVSLFLDQEKKYEKSYNKLLSASREVQLELENVISKYETKIEQYNLIKYNEFVKKSEKTEVEEVNIVNEVEEKLSKEKKKRKSPTEQFVVELKKIVCETKVHEFDFEGNNVKKENVKPFGEDRNIKVEVMPIFKVVEHIRPKYKDKNHIYQTPNDDVFPHSILTPSLASNIINFKFRLSIPLYRYKEFMKSSGINVSESDLCNYVSRTADKIKPIYDELKKELLSSMSIHIDETTLKVVDVKEKEKCYMFVYKTNHWTNNQVSIYEFNESRKTDKVNELLKDYNGNIVCDGYSGYDKIKSSNITIQRCWVHIRRYFVDCYKALPKDDQKKHPAYKIVLLINDIFRFEAIFKDKNYTCEEIIQKRNEKKYTDKLNDIDREISKLSKNDVISDNLLKAINYYNNIKNDDELYTFLKYGYVEIDNNLAERTVKPFVIGRKNFLFCKTKNGADISSILYSIVQTSLNNGLDPEKYVKYTLENIDTVCVDNLMPWNNEVKNKCSINFNEEPSNPVIPG